MQEIIIKIKGDSSDIVKLGEELKKLGKVDEDNAKQFKKNNDDQKKATKEQSASLKDLFKDMTDIKGQLMDIGKNILAAFAVQAIVDFGKESVQAFMEAELNAKKLNTAITTIGGEGEQAFQKLIAQSEALQEKGIFSDDAIQSAQTQLAQYGLFSNEIEALIPKIADMAAATGMDLGQATDVVIQGINGMTRGLRPLGLEFKDTGDKTENLRIVMEKLGKFSGQMDSIMETSAGKVKNWGNAWDDFKEQVGAVLMGQIDTSGAEKLTSEFNAQMDSVINLKQNIEPLLTRYDELQAKSKLVGGETKLSKEEHVELKGIIEKVAGAVPSAITQFDQYGKAIGISTDRVREYMKEEQARLKYLNEDKIKQTKTQIQSLKEFQKDYDYWVDRYTKGEKMQVLVSENSYTGQRYYRDATQKELQAYYDNAKANREKILGAEQELERLNGDFIEKEIKRRKEAAEEQDATRKKQEAEDKATEASAKNKENAQRNRDKAASEAEKKKQKAIEDAANAKKKADDEAIKLAEERYKNEFMLLQLESELADERTKQAAKDFEETKKNADSKVNAIIQSMNDEAKLRIVKEGETKDNLIALENAQFQERLNGLKRFEGNSAEEVQANMDAIKLLTAEHNKNLSDIEINAAKKTAEEKKKISDTVFQVLSQSTAALSNLSEIAYNQDLYWMKKQYDAKYAEIDAYYQSEINLAQGNTTRIAELEKEKANKITQTQQDQAAKDAQLKKEKFERDRSISVFETVINTASAVIKALADPGGLPGLALSILAGVTGATQLGVILSQPAPYAKGTDFLKRGNNPVGVDTIPVMANEGEAIIPTERNLEHPGLAKAWIKGTLDDYININYVIPALKRTNKKDSFADNIAKAIQLNAGFNDSNLLESDKMNRKLLLEQNNLLKKIASGSGKNPHRF